MRRSLRAVPVVPVALVAWWLASPDRGPGVVAAQGPNQPRPVVEYASRTDTSRALRAIPPIPPVAGAMRVLPRKMLPNRLGSGGSSGPDPVVQPPMISLGIPTTDTSFDGIDNRNNVLPPDPVGDVGPNHYVQMVNLSMAVYGKDGSVLLSPRNTNTLWQGFGGPCETTNNGDPIVAYDHLADRWVLTQFALPNFPMGPFFECIAVSQTPDPTGAYHRYEFRVSPNKLNDYPKFGVWPDAYYMAVNQFKQGSLGWAGQGVVAFERDKMLLGQPARMISFDLFNVDSNLGGMLPADLDGPVPPSGAPGYFAQIDDNAWGYSADQLQLWELRADWGNPSSSTFTRVEALGTAPFDSNMCGYSRNCIPQPGGVPVDAIADRLMYRLQYRNFGSHQSMVVNHTVDVNGANLAGIRWYELRNAGTGWSIRQEGTFSVADGLHRWMASIAMDGTGNIALGYSISGTTMSPSIRYTGRLVGDALGMMTLGEGEIVAGAGFQQHGSGRWGDYSMMAVDPTDECTFWYTQEYYASVGTAPWRTRIASFKLPGCGGGGTGSPPSVAIVSPANGSQVAGQVPIQIDASDQQDPAGSLTVEWRIDAGPYQPATYNGASGYYEATWDSTTVPDSNHTIHARATDSDGEAGSALSTVVVRNAPPVVLHVGDLDAVSSPGSRNRWAALIYAEVHDQNHQPVPLALVTGTWSGGASGTSVCQTGADGRCWVGRANLKPNQTVTYTINDVSFESNAYQPGSNHDPDGDSNGTVISAGPP